MDLASKQPYFWYHLARMKILDKFELEMQIYSENI